MEVDGCIRFGRIRGKIIAGEFYLFIVISELLKLVELMVSKFAGNK